MKIKLLPVSKIFTIFAFLFLMFISFGIKDLRAADRYIGPVSDSSLCPEDCTSLSGQCSGFIDEYDNKTYYTCSDNNGTIIGLGIKNTDAMNISQYGTWYKPTISQIQNDLKFSDEETANSTKYTSSMVANIAGTIALQAASPNGSGGMATGDSGAANQFASAISFMTINPPARTVDYIADIGHNAGFISSAYAQGTGAKILSPVLPLWKVFRNMAYMFFIIIFIVIGFMIMFRQQVGQAAISIQIALPQIIITLIIITFSYAIASLLIDFIYLLIYLVIGLFHLFGILKNPTTATNILLSDSIFKIGFSHLIGWTDAAGHAAGAIGDITEGLFAESAIGEVVTNLISGFGSPIAYLIFAVAIVFSIFKIFFQLLMAYMGLIFGIIFAPITLLFNAIPGSDSFNKWLKAMAANALIFPVTAILILIGVSLLGASNFDVNPNIGFQGALLKDGNNSIASLPFLGMNTGGMIGIIGLGFLMMMPKVLEMTQKALGVESGFAGMAGAVMEPIAGAWGNVKKLGLGYTKAKARDLMYEDPGWKGKLATNWLASMGQDVRDSANIRTSLKESARRRG